MAKRNIAVVMGGPSAEHEISLLTGQTVLQNLNPEKYTPIKVVITKNRLWQFEDKTRTAPEALTFLKEKHAIIFIALHGSYGEDGTLQGLCELYGVSYTGSSAVSSILSMDKVSSNELFAKEGLNVPEYLFYSQDQDVHKIVSEVDGAFTYPLVIKPARQGSSVGVRIVHSKEALKPAVEEAFRFDENIIAQEYIKGREVSCGVLKEGSSLTALPPTELIPVVSEFFDYRAKYEKGGTKEITPPDMDAAMLEKIQEIAVRCHAALGCGAYSRTDMMLQDETLYVIEINPLPGFADASIYPQQARAAGLSLEQLLDTIITNAEQK